MRIGVMLRTIDERQGIGIYTQNLMDHLIPLDTENDYILFYRNPEYLGRYKQYAHVSERLITAYNKAIWDQLKIPIAARREKVDILFHTKFTVPLITRIKSAMVLHGSEWFVHPDNCGVLDRIYIRIMMPLYCSKTSAISSVSHFTADDIRKYINIDARKLFVIHSAINSGFQPINDNETSGKCKKKYRLPERYILYVGKSYPGKNFLNILKAFKEIKEKTGSAIKLVAVGNLEADQLAYGKEIQSHNLEDDIIFTGWVDQNDLPVFYRLAELLLFPSFYEGFGIPILEAMACGCPVVTSSTGACPEIAGTAATFVNPERSGSIAQGVIAVMENSGLKNQMISEGLKRAASFSWDKAAAETVQMFHNIYQNGEG